MLFSNEQTTAQMSQLFGEARQWWELQKQYLSLHGTEILTRLFSAIALWAILILVGAMVLLFGSFALAFWLGDLLGSTMLGFGIIAVVLLLAVMLVWANKRSWIVLPITRFMVSLLVSELAVPTQEGVALEKEHVRKQLENSQGEMRQTASNILSPATEARNGWDNAMGLFQNGMTIYRGVQIGLGAVAAFRSFFKLGKKRR